jgi:hypothetical protein
MPTSEKRTGFHALLVGIDRYTHGDQTGFRNLSGCVADVEDMRHFLVTTMNVPLTHIVTLINEEATRSRIIGEIEALAKEDNTIQRDDPILIYYAGHGAETPAPAGWPAGGPGVNIQMIVPHDFNPYSSDQNTGGIFDIILSARLSALAKAKGNNIVCTPQLSLLPTFTYSYVTDRYLR